MTNQIIQFSIPETWLRFEMLSYAAPYQSVTHHHQAWQLTAAMEGEFRFRTKEKTIILQPGEWLLFSPGSLHDAGSDSPHSIAVQLFFRRFPKSLLPDFAAVYNFRRNILRTGKFEIGQLHHLANDLLQHGNESAPERDSWRLMLTLKFILSLLSPIPQSEKPYLHPKIMNAIEYMEAHFPEPVAVADIATAVSLSENRFAVLFKEKTGTTPMQFLNSLRLDNAQSLLLQGLSLTETAQLSGFSSNQYFCRYFRKCTGKTPGEFRKSPFHYASDFGKTTVYDNDSSAYS